MLKMIEIKLTFYICIP